MSCTSRETAVYLVMIKVALRGLEEELYVIERTYATGGISRGNHSYEFLFIEWVFYEGDSNSARHAD